MKNRFQPKYDSLQVFSNSKTPAGLYARQKWRYEENTENWVRDFISSVKALREGQLPNGSWNDSEIDTIKRLFGLHLTVREIDDSIELALDWLINKRDQTHFPVIRHMASKNILSNLPFSNGCYEHFVNCAGLFLANCFRWGEEKKVAGLYDRIGREIEAKGGHLCSIECTNNALRAFVVHERYSRSRAVMLMVKYLGRRQLASGRWKGRTPLYMTLNALAHLDSGNARRQCIKAIENILKSQNRDGTWGRVQKEWNTFLVVHALRRLNA